MAGRHRTQPQRRQRRHGGRHRRPTPSSHVAVPALVVAAVLGGVAVGITQTGSSSPPPPPAPVAAPSSPGAPTPAPTPTPPVSPSPSSTAHAHSASPHRAAHHRPARAHRRTSHADTFVVTVTGNASWLEVTHDDRVLTERILHHGQRAAYREHGLLVTLGSAGDTRVAIDGHRPRRPGADGAVVHLVVH